jgi:hypothetical protein
MQLRNKKLAQFLALFLLVSTNFYAAAEQPANNPSPKTTNIKLTGAIYCSFLPDNAHDKISFTDDSRGASELSFSAEFTLKRDNTKLIDAVTLPSTQT